MARVRKPASPARWALQDAKNRLSEVVEAAWRGHPQIVTRRGVETAVIISHDEYTRMTAAPSLQRPSIAEYLLDGPTVDGGETFERITLRPRGLRKPRRSLAVVEWIARVPPAHLHISVITIGEIAKGIARRRRTAGGVPTADALQSWLEGLLTTYADRIIPVDMPIAARWGRLCDLHPQLATDMLLAATALDRGLIIATRNTERFEVANVPVFNPFVS